jgi:protein-S-isoprenylcysteine O-methyltransferase Ste14
MPPRCVLLFWPPIFVIVGLLLTAKGRDFLDHLNLERLTLLHAIRIPVALVFLALCYYKAVPELLTFRGRNFDLLAGLTAPFMWYFGLVKNQIGRRALLVWNLAGFALLVNLVVNAILSGPYRFQLFAFDQPSVAFLYFPFVWMVCGVVPLLFLAHVAAIRRLLVSEKLSESRPAPGRHSLSTQLAPKDHPAVIIFPPALPLGGLALGLILQYFFPIIPEAEWLPAALRETLGVALLLLGISFMAGARVTMMRAGTNVHPGHPAIHLVESGPFRRSRNPMYLGGNLVLLGVSFVFRLYWIPLLMPVLVTICHYGVVLQEEAYLERKFGRAYLDYKARVRRWL